MTAITAQAPALPTQRSAFGKIVLNEARLTLRQPTGLIGGLAFPIVLLFVFNAITPFHKQLGPRRAHRVRHLRADPHRVQPRHARPVQPAGSARLLPRARHPAPPFDHPGPPVLAARRAGRDQRGRRGGRRPRNPGRRRHRPSARPSRRTRPDSRYPPANDRRAVPLGLLVASVARSANSASIIGRAVFFPLIFLAGLWWPRELMPAGLRVLSDASPLGAAVQALQDSVQTASPRPCPCWSWPPTRWRSATWPRFFRWE